MVVSLLSRLHGFPFTHERLTLFIHVQLSTRIRAKNPVLRQSLLGDRYAPCLIWIDRETTAEDITAELLAYLGQDEIIPWEESIPWAKQYVRQFGGNPDAGALNLRMGNSALPMQANALRPLQSRPSPGQYYSIREAASELGITEHQLRRLIKEGKIQIHDMIKCGKASYIPHAEVERLMDDEKIQKAIERRDVRQRHRREKAASANLSEEVSFIEERIAKCEEFLSRAKPDEEKVDVWERWRDSGLR